MSVELDIGGLEGGYIDFQHRRGCLSDHSCFYLFDNSNPALRARPTNKFFGGLYIKA